MDGLDVMKMKVLNARNKHILKLLLANFEHQTEITKNKLDNDDLLGFKNWLEQVNSTLSCIKSIDLQIDEDFRRKQI